MGAAAGYAMLAFKFRNFSGTSQNANRFAAGSAEMRASEAFTREWVRQAEGGGARTAGAAGSGRTGGSSSSSSSSSRGGSGSREQHTEDSQHRSSAVDSNGAPAWALAELGVDNRATYSEVKAAYRERALSRHPDTGGTAADADGFKRLTSAWEAVQPYVGRKS